MAKTTGFLSQTSGKLDDNFTTRQTAFGTILAKTPRKTSTPRRSEKQANMRCQLANMSANYRLYDGKLTQAFEGKGTGLSDFNLFVSTNYGTGATFITKQERIAGACVLAGYQFSRGSLPSIGYEINGSGVLVSDVALGSLVIGEATTVSELTIAILQQNTGWEDGDQLTFFNAMQWRDSEGMPRATMTSKKVVLDTTNETVLWSIVGEGGFKSVGGYLGMNHVLDNEGAAWVHSRENGNTLKVSTQRLVVVSDILEEYQGYAAFKASADSYGGINTKAVYLNPSSTVGLLPSGTSSGSSGSGSSGSSGSSTGSETGGGSGSGSGGSETGGGSQTVTVAAPTFSGETQFTETTQVTMSAESGATIRYTLDGSTPTASTGQVYSSPVTLSATTTVKAVAVKDGVTSSVTSRTYTKTESGGGTGGGSGFDG